MNSILHTCTHSDNDTLSRMTEDQMYAAIFTYIEHLFEIIKPKQVFYMAIDGVAPRAKMNQQRARRFRTAYEAELNLKKAIQRGEVIPKEDAFDSNSITPGTEFMAKLTDNLKYFIHKKISEDSRWANIKIVLSGHEVPGEGEHKIMSYIRSIKAKPNYDGNLRHCVYGLDADLIMLGLVSHDPHFSLLREEVTFGPRSNKKSTDVNEQKFFLLHLSLVREYLSLEFQDLDNQLLFEYDFEKVLDDLILILYVIGNDFLPNLPDLFINKGAFPLLIATFKQCLKTTDGYINEGGKINFVRLRAWLTFLAEFELENFEKSDVDVDWFNKRLEDISLTGEKKRERTGRLLLLKDQKKLVGAIKPWLLDTTNKPIAELLEREQAGTLPTLSLPSAEVEHYLDFVKQFALEAGILIVHSRSNNTYEARFDVDGINPHETEEEFHARINDLRKTIKKYQSANLFETEELMKESKDIYDAKFVAWKDKYYKDKLHFSINDEKEMIDLTQSYLEGLQWVLYYYYKGCPSWNWFYKYHYAPRISDISIGLDAYINAGVYEISFDLSQPFKPFEQLMAVLPARSRQLMPVVYRPLMTDEQSPIHDFYPHEVEVDLNGKTASWEAVVLLSFVDEKRLIDVLKPLEAKLSPLEAKRNSFGGDIQFVFNPQIDQVFPSPLPGFFHDLEHDRCYEVPFAVEPAPADFKFDLGVDAKFGKDLLAGFPTLHTIEFEHQLALKEIKVFQNPSRSESMILSLKNPWADYTIDQFSHRFLGKIVYTNWPFLRESRVVSIVDGQTRYESVKAGNSRKVVSRPLASDEERDFNVTRNSISATFARNKGIVLGKILVLVYVQPVTGLIRTSRGALVKTFSTDTVAYPIQLIVKEVNNTDERFATRAPLPIDEEYPLDSQVVFLGAFAYGAPATVVGYSDANKVNIKVSKIQTTAEPNIGKRRVDIEAKEIRYVPSFQVSKMLKLHPLFLSQITSGFMLEDDTNNGRRVNVGLELKFEGRRQKVLGYTQKSFRAWEFSPLAIQLIKDYQKQFPKFFQNLVNLVSTGGTRVFPKVTQVTEAGELAEIRKWLKKVKEQFQLVSLESQLLTRFSLNAIETYMDNYISQPPPLSNKDIKGVPTNAILDPAELYQLLNSQRFDLGDRVVYVQDSGKVPKLSKGTVVSIITSGAQTSLTVVFDHPLLSGHTLDGKLQTKRGMTVDLSLVLNLTNRQLVYHSKASKDRKPLTPQQLEARQKQVELAKAAKAAKQQEQQQKQQQKQTKKSNELLSILKQVNGAKAERSEDDDDAEASVQPSAIKQIYGQIYSNVMNEGQPPAFPYGAPPQGYVPVVPGAPLPPQFFQPPPVPVNGVGQPSSQNQNGHNGHEKSRGRGGHRGRGRGRGRPKKE